MRKRISTRTKSGTTTRSQHNIRFSRLYRTGHAIILVDSEVVVDYRVLGFVRLQSTVWMGGDSRREYIYCFCFQISDTTLGSVLYITYDNEETVEKMPTTTLQKIRHKMGESGSSNVSAASKVVCSGSLRTSPICCKDIFTFQASFAGIRNNCFCLYNDIADCDGRQ